MKRRVPLVSLLLLTACSATAPTMLDGDVSLVVSPHVRGGAQRTLQADVSGLSGFDIYTLDLTLSDGTTTSAPRTYTAAQLHDTITIQHLRHNVHYTLQAVAYDGSGTKISVDAASSAAVDTTGNNDAITVNVPVQLVPVLFDGAASSGASPHPQVLQPGGFASPGANPDASLVGPSLSTSLLVGCGVNGSYNGGAAESVCLNQPMDLTINTVNPSDHDLVVADSGNHRVIKVSPSGTITVLAGNGTPGAAGVVGGPLAANMAPLTACLNTPCGVAYGSGGVLYIADSGNHCIRQLDPDGQLYTIAGSGLSGLLDGLTSLALFVSPTSLAVSPGVPNDTLYVSDTGGNTLRRCLVDYQAHSANTVAHAGNGSASFADDQGVFAGLDHPAGLVLQGSQLYFMDSGNHALRVMDTNTMEVSTLAGTFPGWWGGDYHTLAFPAAASYVDGDGFSARFAYPQGLTYDPIKNRLLIADRDNHCIRAYDFDGGNVSTVINRSSLGWAQPPQGYAEGPASAARFDQPQGLAQGPAGSFYVSDVGSGRVRVLQYTF